jgi:hypothetical protein
MKIKKIIRIKFIQIITNQQIIIIWVNGTIYLILITSTFKKIKEALRVYPYSQ